VIDTTGERNFVCVCVCVHGLSGHAIAINDVWQQSVTPADLPKEICCKGGCFKPLTVSTGVALLIISSILISEHSSGDGSWMPSRPHSVYVADVISGGKAIGSRRMFATCSTGIPDGLKTDAAGNLFAGCGDGLHIFSPSGRELGVILVGGVANFALTKDGIVMLQEDKITHVLRRKK